MFGHKNYANSKLKQFYTVFNSIVTTLLILRIVTFNNNYDHVLKQELLMLKKTYQFPKDGQQLRPKHVAALIKK